MKTDRERLVHCRDACERILVLVADGEEVFRKDFRAQDSMLRSFQILGEAAKKVSVKTRNQWPGVPWRQIAGMRDKLVHEYFGVNLDVVWRTAITQIKGLRDQFVEVLSALEAGSNRS